jgi:signal transduction histidine kinase
MPLSIRPALPQNTPLLYQDVTSQGARVHGTPAAASREAIFGTIASLSRTLAHTLGNPLAGLSLTLELLGGTPLTPAQHRYLERSNRVMERLNVHKENLGHLGCPPTLIATSFAVAPVIRDVLENMRLGTHFDVCVDVEASCPHILGHSGLVAEALTHLLRNATEALEQGGRLGVRAQSEGDNVCITVWDCGPGLSTAAQEDLWIKPIMGKNHGAGMGLFWVAAIVERVHQGTLSYTPRQPCGAAFHMKLAQSPASGEGHP